MRGDGDLQLAGSAFCSADYRVAVAALHFTSTFYGRAYHPGSSKGSSCTADDLSERAPQDASRISLKERWQVRYWTKALGVSEARLHELVKEYGDSATAVRSGLGK